MGSEPRQELKETGVDGFREVQGVEVEEAAEI